MILPLKLDTMSVFSNIKHNNTKLVLPNAGFAMSYARTMETTHADTAHVLLTVL